MALGLSWESLGVSLECFGAALELPWRWHQADIGVRLVSLGHYRFIWGCLGCIIGGHGRSERGFRRVVACLFIGWKIALDGVGWS